MRPSQLPLQSAGEVSNVARFLSLSAEESPAAPAVIIPGGSSETDRIYDFIGVESDANRIARGFLHSGIHRGSRTLVMVRPGLDLILTVFALFKIGAVPILIDPGMGLAAFLSCVARTKPEALVGIPLAHGVSRVFPARFRSVGVRVQVGGRQWLDWLQGGEAETVLAATTAGDLAAILFTSGSTGSPKGVHYTHGVFEAQVRLIREQYGIERGEVDMPMLPVFALFNPAFGMATVVPPINPSRPATVDPAKVVAVIRRLDVTNSFGSPVLWDRISRYCQREGITLPGLRRVLVAGAPAHPSLIRLMAGVLTHGRLHTPYGATECLPVSSISGEEIVGGTWAGTERGGGTCVGRLFPEMEARIIPVFDGAIESLEAAGRLPMGQKGELIVRGPVVTTAYDGLPDATRLAKISGKDGAVWHRMGDVAYLDGGGRLWFCGRVAERVVTRFGVLYTDCCEGILNACPAVSRTALVGIGEPGNQIPLIAIEAHGQRAIFSRSYRQQIIEQLRELLSEHPILNRITGFQFVRKFPVDVRHNAKIHRLTLARRFAKKLATSIDALRSDFEKGRKA